MSEKFICTAEEVAHRKLHINNIYGNLFGLGCSKAICDIQCMTFKPSCNLKAYTNGVYSSASEYQLMSKALGPLVLGEGMLRRNG